MHNDNVTMCRINSTQKMIIFLFAFCWWCLTLSASHVFLSTFYYVLPMLAHVCVFVVILFWCCCCCFFRVTLFAALTIFFFCLSFHSVYIVFGEMPIWFLFAGNSRERQTSQRHRKSRNAKCRKTLHHLCICICRQQSIFPREREMQKMK